MNKKFILYRNSEEALKALLEDLTDPASKRFCPFIEYHTVESCCDEVANISIAFDQEYFEKEYIPCA